MKTNILLSFDHDGKSKKTFKFVMIRVAVSIALFSLNFNCFSFTDRKFGVKARLSGALPITFGLIRTNTGNFEILQPSLQVLKIYATNCKFFFFSRLDDKSLGAAYHKYTFCRSCNSHSAIMHSCNGYW